jgi:hypothetical protein
VDHVEAPIHEQQARQRAKHIGNAKHGHADDHQPGLAEQIGGGANHGLNDGEGECEHREKLAAVAILMPKSPATCGSTGSSVTKGLRQTWRAQ